MADLNNANSNKAADNAADAAEEIITGVKIETTGFFAGIGRTCEEHPYIVGAAVVVAVGAGGYAAYRYMDGRNAAKAAGLVVDAVPVVTEAAKVASSLGFAGSLLRLVA